MIFLLIIFALIIVQLFILLPLGSLSKQVLPKKGQGELPAVIDYDQLLDIMNINSRVPGPVYIKTWEKYRDDSTPKMTLDELPDELKYVPNSEMIRPTMHWGQRKLFFERTPVSYFNLC
jgi:hypothetical protein